MLKISLYQSFCVGLCVICINTYDYRKNQSYTTDRPATSAIRGRLSQRQKPCLPHTLSRRISEINRPNFGTGRLTDRNDPYFSQFMGETLRDRGNPGIGDPSGTWTQTYNGLFGRGGCPHCHRERQAECKESKRSLATVLGQRSKREYLQSFFIRIGARYRRIRKRPKGKPSPQPYAYKTEKLQGLEHQAIAGLIDLYYGDESHICTEGYVPYGWQFRDEDVHIPSQRGLRLNLFGMIDRYNRYHGFSAT